jgi:predicted dehydrogenase
MKYTNKIFNIAIIGAGQLGSRHLQGLKLADIEMNIYVVDVNENSLKIAKERYNQVTENIKIRVFRLIKSITQLPNEIDLVIIATGSLVRASLTKELLSTKKVQNIVFEKVLFPSLHEYTQIEDLLTKYDVKAWVNCARRMHDHYQELRKETECLQSINLTVTGKNWGLGCNAIHFLDLFVFLSNEKSFSLYLNLDNEIQQSKRVEYVEFTGEIKGANSQGSTFSISSLKEYEESSSISITGKDFNVLIEESNNKMIVNGNERLIQVPFQSQLTGKLAEQILSQGKCYLTTFEESALVHRQFMTPLIAFYNYLTGNKDDYCPIT